MATASPYEAPSQYEDPVYEQASPYEAPASYDFEGAQGLLDDPFYVGDRTLGEVWEEGLTKPLTDSATETVTGAVSDTVQGTQEAVDNTVRSIVPGWLAPTAIAGALALIALAVVYVIGQLFTVNVGGS